MDFFQLIKSNRKYLNENEEALLDYLFAHKESIKKMTVREIAEDNFTVPNSIIRLCKKLGFSGFIDFRESFYHATSFQKSMIKMTALDEQIVKTKQLMNETVLHAVLEKIHTSHRILLFAVGLSRLVAEDLHQRLSTVGKNTKIFVDPHVMDYNAKMLTCEDLVFAISLSGSTDVPIQATTIAKTAGAVTVSITGFSNNPLSQLTDFQFFGMTSEVFIDGIDVSDRLSHVYIVNHIFSEYVRHYLIPKKNKKA